MDHYLQRKNRGWIENEELIPYKKRSVDELLTMLFAKHARDRTIAARLLPLSSEVTKRLLEALPKETALYTRLAITEKLESGDRSTVKKMLPLLGTIGKNQHRSPIVPSKKKSFPLPRDLIARSLGRMNPAVFPFFIKAAGSISSEKLSELIDAIGFMAFYHPNLATDENYQALLTIKEAYPDNPLIQWKLLICFSAFPQSKDLLLQERNFVAEAQRSLKLIEKRSSS